MEKLTFLTALLIIGLLIIFIYHEYLRPSYNIALTKAYRMHKLIATYKNRVDNGIDVPSYYLDNIRIDLEKVQKILDDELLKNPDDPSLLAASGDLTDDYYIINPTNEQTIAKQ